LTAGLIQVLLERLHPCLCRKQGLILKQGFLHQQVKGIGL
jgi:hypothetical protein